MKISSNVFSYGLLTLFAILVLVSACKKDDMDDMDDHSDPASSWVLIKTEYWNNSLSSGEWSEEPLGEFQTTRGNTSYYTKQEERGMEISVTNPNPTPPSTPQYLHGYYTWEPPPSKIKPDQNVNIEVNQEVLSNVTGGLGTRISLRMYMNFNIPVQMVITKPVDLVENKYTDIGFGMPSTRPEAYNTGTKAVVFSGDSWGVGAEGSQQELRIYASHGAAETTMYTRYIYEWK